MNALISSVVAYFVILSWYLCEETEEIPDEALRTIGASSSMRNMQLPNAKEERIAGGYTACRRSIVACLFTRIP